MHDGNCRCAGVFRANSLVLSLSLPPTLPPSLPPSLREEDPWVRPSVVVKWINEYLMYSTRERHTHWHSLDRCGGVLMTLKPKSADNECYVTRSVHIEKKAAAWRSHLWRRARQQFQANGNFERRVRSNCLGVCATPWVGLYFDGPQLSGRQRPVDVPPSPTLNDRPTIHRHSVAPSGVHGARKVRGHGQKHLFATSGWLAPDKTVFIFTHGTRRRGG